MNNSFFNYNQLILDNTYQISDAAYSYSIPASIINENPIWFFKVEVEDDIKLETLAYKYYGDIKYWDLIIELNKLETFYSLPKNQDVVYNKAIEKTLQWGVDFGYDFTSQEYASLYEIKFAEFHNEESIMNEKNRYIIMIRTEYLPNLMKAIQDDTSN